jgi:hypothetical protein
MNDLEELVREELLARVAAAEAKQQAEPVAALLGGLDRRIRAARLRRRWTAAALSAVAMAAAIALPLTLLSPGPAGPSGPVTPRGIPLTDTSATPPGWVPVAYGDTQISVPADWRVADRPVCGRVGRGGYVILGRATTRLSVRNPRCRQAPNMVAILPLPRPSASAARPTGVINGITVARVPSARGYVSYLVPRLHARVTARGPLAGRVLATLTRSPLSVVLAPGRDFPVPRGWTWRDFGGIRFAAPAGWRLERARIWVDCPRELPQAAVTLITATKGVMVSCAGPVLIAGSLTARPGVVVAAGPAATRDVPRGSPCRRLHGLRACYAEPIYLGGVLGMSVYVPGRRQPTVVEIGLAGNGAVARAIFDSIRPG